MATARPGGLTVPFSAAVLCGGASRRMGEDKATLEIEGCAMAARVAAAARRAGARDVVAVGGDTAALESLGLEVVADDEPGEGPFPATLTALRAASADIVMVLSCDLLTPNPEAIATMVSRLGLAGTEVVAAVPVVDGHHQWTHVAWRRTALSFLEDAQRAGASSLRRACAALPLELITDLAASDVADADEPGDLPGAR